jgi:CheY-like chemotaxis protein
MTLETKFPEILLVEDNLLGREIVSSMLKDAGYFCQATKNGEEALLLMENFSFDLVLMDVEMPIMDGITAVKKIREKYGNEIPVIALTAHHTQSEKEKCLAAGMNAVLVKPLQQEELVAAISGLLNQGTAAVATAAFATGNKTLIDLAYLEQITKGNEKFFLSMLDIFLEQNPEDLKTLNKAVLADDFETIKVLAHKIKTSVVFIGLDKHLRDLLSEMEELAKQSEQPGRIRELFGELNIICTEAETQLKEIMTQRKNKISQKS